MKGLRIVLLIVPVLWTGALLRAQCTNNNTLLGAAITPPCPGSTTSACVTAGQYILVNVVAGNTYTFNVCTAAWDTQITLYNNTGGGSLGYNDDFCGPTGFASQVTWVATFTGQLRVLVDQWNCTSSGNCAPVNIACAAPPPPVTNNEPCTSTNLPVNTSCVTQNFSNVGSTITTIPPSPGCGLVTGGDVWFSFTAPPSGIVNFQTGAGTLLDAVMAVYSATNCSAALTEVGCDDDSGPGLMPYLSLTGLTPGNVYYIRIFGFSGATGTFNICLTTIALPAGDCVYQLSMFDSFGDGWDGSTVGISINGGPFTNYTLPGGSNGIALIGVNIGDIVIVQYTENSFFPGEISYSIGPGCIWSDGPTPSTGIVFTQTVDCQPAPSPPEDCSGAITICNNQAFNNNTQSTGCAFDLDAANQGCLASAERQGTWYYFSPSTGGNVAFTISPTDPTDDYDFAIWGPFPPGNPICPPPGAPLRCSYAAPAGDTGLNYTAVDASEGAGGDKWVDDLAVVAGQVYILYVSNFSQSGLAFNLNWSLTNGASLDCTVLPVELSYFGAQAENTTVKLTWGTATEMNSDHFMVERSVDGQVYVPIGRVDAAGNSTSATHYAFSDMTATTGLHHYRLRQVDLDGQYAYSPIATVLLGGQVLTGVPYPNPSSSEVGLDLVVANDGLYRMQCIDLLGRTQLDQPFEARRGQQTVVWDVRVLDAGPYLMRILTPDGTVQTAGSFAKY